MDTQTQKLGMEADQDENISIAAKDHIRPSSISKFRVIIRLRPFLAPEIYSKNGEPVSCVSSHESEASDDVTILIKDQETSQKKCYKIDAFFRQQDNNVRDIFEREVKTLIHEIFQAYNATIFAFGATCGGKTYTMQV